MVGGKATGVGTWTTVVEPIFLILGGLCGLFVGEASLMGGVGVIIGATGGGGGTGDTGGEGARGLRSLLS